MCPLTAEDRIQLRWNLLDWSGDCLHSEDRTHVPEVRHLTQSHACKFKLDAAFLLTRGVRFQSSQAVSILRPSRFAPDHWAPRFSSRRCRAPGADGYLVAPAADCRLAALPEEGVARGPREGLSVEAALRVLVRGGVQRARPFVSTTSTTTSSSPFLRERFEGACRRSSSPGRLS